MKLRVIFYLGIMTALFASCASKTGQVKVVVSNPSVNDRTIETVSIPLESIDAQKLDFNKSLVAEDSETGKVYATQVFKSGLDENNPKLLFQPSVSGNKTNTYTIRYASEEEAKLNDIVHCYSRFVPERIDDYAWENDMVAFRTYGPVAQQLTEEGKKGGTLSSGIDCWHKRVNYSIIDKWYDKPNHGGTYHKDDGEGYDGYHVGISRGCGGTGVFDEETYTLYTSKNYYKWEKLTDGNIRGAFVLSYKPWFAGNDSVVEDKYITIDKGANFSRYEIKVTGTDVLTVGITLHKKDGKITMNKDAGWYNYWEPYFGSEFNSAVVADPKYIVGYEKYDIETPDASNILVHLKVVDGKVVFYSGFTWKEANQFQSQAEWENYLTAFADQISNPMQVSVQ